MVQQGVARVALRVAPQQLLRARRQQVGVLAGAGEKGTGGGAADGDGDHISGLNVRPRLSVFS